jgi:hypothetical protein
MAKSPTHRETSWPGARKKASEKKPVESEFRFHSKASCWPESPLDASDYMPARPRLGLWPPLQQYINVCLSENAWLATKWE